jgi:hypothetical protein
VQSVVWDYRVILFGYGGYGLCRRGAGSAGGLRRSTLGLAGGYLHWLFGCEVVVQKC